MVSGTFGAAGPGGAWLRLTVPLVDGETRHRATGRGGRRPAERGQPGPIDMTVGKRSTPTSRSAAPIAAQRLGQPRRTRMGGCKGTGMAEAVVHGVGNPDRPFGAGSLLVRTG